jgi:uncharacterized protein GlcG (DUF336 family)
MRLINKVVNNTKQLNEAVDKPTVLDFDTAQKIINKCVSESKSDGLFMNIAVVDATGRLKAFARMDGAWIGSIEIAQSKAFTALAFSGDEDKQGPLPTDKLGDLSQPKKDLFGIQNTNPNDGIVIFGGGVPLYINKKLVGAVGISGSSVDNDMKIAAFATSIIS